MNKKRKSNTAETQQLNIDGVMHSCFYCGNRNNFETWEELEYDDGTDEPSMTNHLINVEYVKCLNCGEVL